MSVTDTMPPRVRSSIDWGAILAGGALATALGLVLLGFGASLGLGLTSPYEGEGLSPVAFAIAAGLYLLWVQILSFYFGGYVTARLMGRAPGASEHETDVRDGLHGLLVWSVGVIAAAVITLSGVAGGAATAASADAGQSSVSASVAHVVDQQVEEGAREEAQSAPPGDASIAERRAEVVRKLSVVSGFITAASLLVGAVAAFFGAHSGGNHRDGSVTWQFFTSRARVRSPSRS